MGSSDPPPLRSQIACLAWGSLVWDPRTLPVSSRWRSDGPLLPIEFARISANRRVTLVLLKGARLVQCLWATLGTQTIGEAVEALAAREGAPTHRIAYWSPQRSSPHLGAKAVRDWAHSRQLAGVVWTGLPPRDLGDDIATIKRAALEHILSLDPEYRSRAEEYIRNAPPQIDTPVRRHLEETLGLTRR